MLRRGNPKVNSKPVVGLRKRRRGFPYFYVIIALGIGFVFGIIACLSSSSGSSSAAAIERRPNQTKSKTPKIPKIPKILHQIWISRDGKSSNPLPEFCAIESQRMKKVHEAEGWEYHLWRDELWEMYKDDRIVSFYFSATFDKHTVAFIADRFRLLLLRDFGGVFCDVDAKLVTSFSRILDKIAPDTTFFAGMRNLEGQMPGAPVEVAVMGSEKHGRVVTNTAAKYEPPSHGDLSLPHGGRVGRWLTTHFDMHTVILNYRFFYANTNEQTEETVVLQNGFELGTWRNSVDKAFVRAMDASEKAALLMIVEILFKVAATHGLAMWLGGNTLLGYGRNGTLQPWDDGCELMLEENAANIKAFETLVKPALSKHGLAAEKFWGGYKVFVAKVLLVTVYLWIALVIPFEIKASKIKGFKWSFPSVDLRFYKTAMKLPHAKAGEAAGAAKVLMVHERGLNGRIFEYPVSSVKPLRSVKLEGIPVTVPRDVSQILRIKLGRSYMNECDSRSWDKRLESGLSPMRADCHAVQHMYFFKMYQKNTANLRAPAARH